MTLRVFAALPIDDQLADQVETVMNQVPGAKWRPRGNLHITLAFYGELNEAVIADLDTELGRIAQSGFALRLKGTGHFGSNPPTSLWLGVEDDPGLRQLAKACRRAGLNSGVEMERRAFHPHLTVAYLPGSVELVRVQRFEQRHSLFVSDPFWVDRFHLYASRPRKPGVPNLYTREAEYPLV